MINRAYSQLEIKAFDATARTIQGVATSPSTDRMGDIVEPLGINYKNPMPLLWQHSHDKPVGTATFDKPTANGVNFTATIATIDEPGILKDRVDEAWQSIKAGLVRAVSIGFRPLEQSMMKDGGYRFNKCEVMELSLVTIPAQAEATINVIKSIDTAVRAATGLTDDVVVRLDPPGVTGPPKRETTPKEGRFMKTIAEQMAAFEATRTTKSVRMNDIMNKAGEEGVTLDAEQTVEYDDLALEVKSINDHLVRLSAQEKTNIAIAKPVDGVASIATGSEVRSGVVMQKSQLPKGTSFTRYAMALAAAGGSKLEAAEYAKRWNSSTPEVEIILRAAINPGAVPDANYGPLVVYQNMASEFIDLLRPQTIIGKVTGMRKVPFNIKIPAQTGAGTVGWVGEATPKPVGQLTFAQLTLGMTKAAGIIVLSDELVRASSPSAEALVTADLTKSMATFLDLAFVDPSVPAVPNVSPASITNGANYVTASGTDAVAVRADVRKIFSLFINANLTPTTGVWIMRPTMALTLGMMLNPLGQPSFPGITMNGGTFLGLPVVVSQVVAQSVVNAAAVPPTVAGDLLILVNSEDILLADDGGVALDVSREASVQMNSAPVAGATALLSLWQNNLIGLRAERYINWLRRRPASVAYISGANYAV